MDKSEQYAENVSVQLRKGLLTYCVLEICSQQAMYTSDIINHLREVDLIVVEGTIYPLLSRLQKEGLLTHEWQESEQGPPRKYYRSTSFGLDVMKMVSQRIDKINQSLKKLQEQ